MSRRPGYRSLLGKQWLRLDMAEKLLRDAHAVRGSRQAEAPFSLDPGKAVSMGLTTASYARLLRLVGFAAAAAEAAARGRPRPARAAGLALAAAAPATGNRCAGAAPRRGRFRRARRTGPLGARIAMRIDKLLWFLRLAKTRSIAQAMAEEGHIRLNSRRVDRAHQKVAVGDVLTIPLGPNVRVIALIALPHRRGPAPEAQSCYRVLDETAAFPIAAPDHNDAAEGDLQP